MPDLTSLLKKNLEEKLAAVSDPNRRIDCLNDEAWESRHANPAQSLEWAQQARREAVARGHKRGEARAWHVQGVATAMLSEPNKALQHLQQAFSLYQNLADRHSLVEVTANIAAVYQLMGQFGLALEWQFGALRRAEELSMLSVLGNTLTNIASLYAELEQFEEALDYHQKGLEIKEKREDGLGVAASLTAIGEVHRKLGRIFLALEFQEQSLAKAKTLGVQQAQAYPLLGIGNLRLHLGEFARAEDSFREALEIFTEGGNQQAVAQTHKAFCDLYRQTKAYDKAAEHGNRAVDIAWQIEAKSLQADCHHSLAEAYKDAGKPDKAYKHLESYTTLRTEVLRVHAAQTFNSLRRYHQFQQAEQEKELYRLKNIELEHAKQAILSQKDELEDAFTQLELSIKAASRIQRAMLPQPEHFAPLFQDFFILYIPRDGVSGDFFWLELAGGRIMLAAADCTGHGVPGALMSMLGYTLLKQVVNEGGYTRPDKVLKLLDIHTREVLCRTNHPAQVNDGMDIGLVSICPITFEVQFAGAYNSMYWVHDGALTEVQANRCSIGGKQDAKRIKEFDLKTIQAQPSDCLYLFSDGYADQFGRVGEQIKKLSPKRLRALIEEICHQPMAQQRARLVQEFMTWKGSLPQIDDVLILGVRL